MIGEDVGVEGDDGFEEFGEATADGVASLYSILNIWEDLTVKEEMDLNERRKKSYGMMNIHYVDRKFCGVCFFFCIEMGIIYRRKNPK